MCVKKYRVQSLIKLMILSWIIACKADFTVFSNSLKANLSLSPPIFFLLWLLEGNYV